MLCERCSRNQATTMLTQRVGGRTVTEHLCAECAYKGGFSSLFNGFPFDQMVANLARTHRASGKRCPSCGSSLEEIVESGRIGCSECYTVFRRELMPTIENIHGKAAHIGKRPLHRKEEPPKRLLLAQLRDDLQKAVQEENYEKAAQLRDEIRGMADPE